MRGVRIGHEHHAPLLAMLGDPRVGATMGGTRSAEEVTAVIDRHVAGWETDGFHYWIFLDRETGEAIARGGLSRTSVTGRDEVEVGWVVVPDRWGQSYATELGAAALDVAFGPIALDTVISYTLPENAASRRVMEKLGFSYEREIVHYDLPHVLYRVQPPDSR